MKKQLLFLSTFILTTSMAFVACGGSDDDAVSTPPVVETATQTIFTVQQSGSGISGNTNKNQTGNEKLDTRYEVPRIIGGNDYYSVICEVPTYGVNYIIEWNKAKRAQRWTAYQLYSGNSGSNWNRNNWYQTEWGGDPFQPDPNMPAECRIELSDYRGSGYTRGHMIPSADRLNSKEANEQTFFLSNMHPQKYAINGAPGVWGEMENFLRNKWNTRDFRDVLYVIKGGTIQDGQIKEWVSNGRLLVPQYFFMACVCKKGNAYKGIAFWCNHDQPSATVKSCIISIDELETKTGIDFYCNLPDDVENQVENTVDKTFWKVN